MYGHSWTCRLTVIHWPTSITYTSPREAEWKTRWQSHTHSNECSGKCLHICSRGGFQLTPCRACFFSITKAAAPSGSLGHGGVALQHLLHNHQQMPPTPNTLQPPKLLQVSSCYSFLLAPALQGSNPLYRGQPGWNAVMDARCIFLTQMLWCAQVDSMSKAKHKSSSSLSGVSLLPEADPSSPKEPFLREGAN